MDMVRRIGYIGLFLLVGALMPLGILVAGGVALRHRKQLSRIVDRPGAACSIDNDCPSGFSCINGRCVQASV